MVCPPPLCDFVFTRSVSSIRSSRISSIQDCSISFCRTVFGKSAFSVKATTQWNVLPDDMKSCSSISAFRTRLKNLLKAAQLCGH